MKSRVVVITALGLAAGVYGNPSFCALPRGDRSAFVTAVAAQPAFETVVLDLRNSDPAVRVKALRALADGGYPEAIGPMSRLLVDPIDDIQLETIERLLGFFVVDALQTRTRVALVIERRNPNLARSAFELGPFRLIPRPVPAELLTHLAGAMRDDLPRVRSEAVYALGVMARPPLDAATAPVLTDALRDTDAGVREAAARVLGALRVATAGDALVSAVNDPVEEVRAAAMRALGDIREPRAIQALGEQFEYYRKGLLAEAAFDAIARIGHPSSVPFFQAHLAHGNARVRRWAVEGLARAGDRTALAALDSLTAPKTRAEAMALAYARHRAGRPTVPQLVAGLRERDVEPQVMAYLVDLGRPIVGDLEAHLREPEPAVRERVAMVLGLIGGEEAVAALQRALPDTNVDVSRAVERAIARARLLAR